MNTSIFSISVTCWLHFWLSAQMYLLWFVNVPTTFPFVVVVKRPTSVCRLQIVHIPLMVLLVKVPLIACNCSFCSITIYLRCVPRSSQAKKQICWKSISSSFGSFSFFSFLNRFFSVLAVIALNGITYFFNCSKYSSPCARSLIFKSCLISWVSSEESTNFSVISLSTMPRTASMTSLSFVVASVCKILFI